MGLTIYHQCGDVWGRGIMLLKEYLLKKKLSCSQFARLIGVTVQAVNRYINNHRIPDKYVMPRIYNVTNGEVTANDFHDLPKPRKRK